MNNLVAAQIFAPCPGSWRA